MSGGQTGVDRAALDAAIALDIPYGGWCPKGGLAVELGRPLLVLDPESADAIAEAGEFTGGLGQGARLNFAGPRESQASGIYLLSRRVIGQILSRAGDR